MEKSFREEGEGGGFLWRKILSSDASLERGMAIKQQRACPRNYMPGEKKIQKKGRSDA